MKAKWNAIVKDMIALWNSTYDTSLKHRNQYALMVWWAQLLHFIVYDRIVKQHNRYAFKSIVNTTTDTL